MWWFGLLGCATTTAPVAVERACVDCHPAEHAAWQGSRHALAERDLGPEHGWARELGAVRVIGVAPLVQALVPAEGGRLQAHQLALETASDERFDVFADGRAEGEWGHWTGRGNTWNSRCAACHVTGFQKGLGSDGTYASSFQALGVTCAACHGDASAHASGGPPPINARMEDTCSACHMLRGELGPPMVPGAELLDHVAPTLIDDSRFGPDGRALGETFEANQFLASGMHAGGARCGDCHDPHGGALLADGDALCQRCHEKLGPPVEHAAHEGLACVDCHMPTTTVMQRHPRRDHAFTTPRQGAASDACAGCHPDRPATAPPDPWVEAFANALAGRGWRSLDLKDPARGRRAAGLAALGRYPGDEAAREVLREALESEDPLLRFAAADALLADRDQEARALLDASKDPVRAVRVAAQRARARSGEPLAALPDYLAFLDHNADDPTLRAERGSLRVLGGDPAGLEDLAAASAMDPGDAELVVQRSIALAHAGRPRDALRVLEAAGRPDHGGLQEALGLALANAGRQPEAIAALERSVGVDPLRPLAWRNLALLYGAAGRTSDAKRAAEQAVRLDPADAEFASWAENLK